MSLGWEGFPRKLQINKRCMRKEEEPGRPRRAEGFPGRGLSRGKGLEGGSSFGTWRECRMGGLAGPSGGG